MSAVDKVFADLATSGKGAFIPFVTAGDPDLETTLLAIQEFAERGASLCEVGIPYSDPIADGPVIQASYTRALDAGIRLESVFARLTSLKEQLTMPRLTMVSYSIILRRGLQKYVEAAVAAGVSGLIVPDLLVEEADALLEICRKNELCLAQLVTPTTPRDRAARIAESSSGFLYYVSVTGITGERRELSDQVGENVRWLKERTDLPICIGFGISTADQVKQVREFADGVIVGSAIVKRLAAATPETREEVVKQVGEYVGELIAAGS